MSRSSRVRRRGISMISPSRSSRVHMLSSNGLPPRKAHCPYPGLRIFNSPLIVLHGSSVNVECGGITNRPSGPVTVSSASTKSPPAHPPHDAVNFTQYARTTTPSSGVPVSASTIWPFHGPPACAGQAAASMPSPSNTSTISKRRRRMQPSERLDTPDAVGIHHEPHLEQLHDAIVRSRGVIDQGGPPRLGERDVSEDRVSADQPGRDRLEGGGVAVPCIGHDVAARGDHISRP